MENRDEYMRLVHLNGKLTSALQEVRSQMAALYPLKGEDYRIALRANDGGGDIFSSATLMDDIVVNSPTLFRAEQMDIHNWWVACYLDAETHDRICWSVTARTRPTRIEWVTTEWPEVATYEEPREVTK